jgi:hypothetical protein
MKRAQLQATIDAGARAGSRKLADPNLTLAQRMASFAGEVDRIVEENGYDIDDYENFMDYTREPMSEDTVRVTAKVPVYMNFARVLGVEKVYVSCVAQAKTEVKAEEKKKVTTDVAFVLDLSGSMFNDKTKRDQKFKPMIDAVNMAINSIEAENEENRMSISVFGDDNIVGSKRITHLRNALPSIYGNTIDGREYTYQITNLAAGFPKVFLGMYAYKDNESLNIVVDGGDDYVHLERSTATFTQYGLQLGGKTLVESTEDSLKRIPALFLMSDGESTYADNDPINEGYKNVQFNKNTGAINHIVGWGNASQGNRKEFEYSNELSAVGLYTIEAATYWKTKLASEYTSRNSESTNCRFFCLGYKLDDTVDKKFAQAVLNPVSLRSINNTVDNNFAVTRQKQVMKWDKWLDHYEYQYDRWGRRYKVAVYYEGYRMVDENYTKYIPKPALMLKQKLQNTYDPDIWTDEGNTHKADWPYKNNYPGNYEYADWYMEAKNGDELKSVLSEFANEVVSEARKQRTYLEDAEKDN